MSRSNQSNRKFGVQNVGIGLRTPHISEIIQQKPPIDWLEVLADNYFADGGVVHQQLEAVRSNYPFALHSVGMSLGSTDPLDFHYLKKIQELATRYDCELISDHLCFVNIGDVFLHDLLPLPYTAEAVHHTASRIRQVQDFLGTRILIENVSSYLTYKDSTMSELSFLNTIAEEADCWILLDLNNLYVSAHNHGYNASAALNDIQLDRVKQIHLGGFQKQGKYFLDTHSRPVCNQVWDLFTQLAAQRSDIPTLIEWDKDIPPLDDLLTQAKQANHILCQARCNSRTE